MHSDSWGLQIGQRGRTVRRSWATFDLDFARVRERLYDIAASLQHVAQGGELLEPRRLLDAYEITAPEPLTGVWVNQEIGWAMGRNIPVFMVRMGEDPLGFPSETQWASMASSTPKDVARAIAGWINQLPDFAEDIGGRLITLLAGVQNYYASEEVAKAIAVLDRLTEEQWQRLEAVYWQNDQIYGCVLADRQLKPFFAKHGRQYPPPRPDAGAT